MVRVPPGVMSVRGVVVADVTLVMPPVTWVTTLPLAGAAALFLVVAVSRLAVVVVLAGAFGMIWVVLQFLHAGGYSAKPLVALSLPQSLRRTYACAF